MKINIYCGWFRNTIMKVKPKMINDICFEIPCLECKGTGIWNFYSKKENSYNKMCVTCKGTGKIYV